MKMLDALVRSDGRSNEQRLSYPPQWSHRSPFSWSQETPNRPDTSFQSIIEQGHRDNGVIGGAVEARSLLMSQLRFRFRRDYSQNRRGELWGDRSLRPLEGPTRSETLKRLERDICFAGNAYITMDGGRLIRLEPDRVSLIMRSEMLPDWTEADNATTIPPDARIVGYAYHAERHGSIMTVFPASDVAHWMPEPDPLHWWRGESWITGVMREIVTDGKAVDHTARFFDHAATPNMVFTFPPERSVDEIRAFAEVLNTKHAGSDNAYKNMFLAGGADVTQVGADLSSLSLKDLTGGFETRIAARARIPGVILGIREGYAGSSLNAGNYGSARRMWADGWFTPHAESLCASLSKLVPPPGGSELHYDPEAVLFLQEDVKDAADILQTQAVTLRQLVEAGFDPASATEAVTTGDMTKLTHTGNVSVQLQPPGTGGSDE